jgi:hypothetical protein
MREVLRLFTPPEWSSWRLVAKLVYVAVFVGLMVPVTMFARWLSFLVIPD